MSYLIDKAREGKKKASQRIDLLHGGLRLLCSGQMEVSVCAVTLF